MIAARANDGSGASECYQPPSSKPGEWQLTPDCPATGGVFLQWRKVTPFAIRSAEQFRSDPPPALSSDRYTRDYREVKQVGALNSTERPKDRADVARFYAAVGESDTWNPVARQVAAAQGTSLSENARAFALLNMAMSDAGVALIETKYHYHFWRPETAIRAGHADDNPRTAPDPSFLPFVITPCHPSYPSGHASASYPAREVLERIFGGRNHSIPLSSPTVPGVTLKYTRLKEITEDIDDARVYGGIHFRFDQEAGAEQGRRLGAYVYKHNLGRAQSGDCGAEERDQ
ncbi:MAG: vanadium-dependent haloperoxidase [Gammaproteobacteria bacterium]